MLGFLDPLGCSTGLNQSIFTYLHHVCSITINMQSFSLITSTLFGVINFLITVIDICNQKQEVSPVKVCHDVHRHSHSTNNESLRSEKVLPYTLMLCIAKKYKRYLVGLVHLLCLWNLSNHVLDYCLLYQQKLSMLKFKFGYNYMQYVWEQAEFDIIERKTRISLHFHLQKEQKKLRHAFSYNWRL